MSRSGYVDIEFEIQFGISEIFAVKRRKTVTNIDILSLIGGFLGLFAGFSFLSAGEIILHFVINPLDMLVKRKSTRVHAILYNTKPKWESKIWNYVVDFLKNSSIHSFSHIGNNKKIFLQRYVVQYLNSIAIS